jgi:hypothetical protein
LASDATFRETACVENGSILGFGEVTTQSLILEFDQSEQEYRVLGQGVDEIFGPNDRIQSNSDLLQSIYQLFPPLRRLILNLKRVDDNGSDLTRFAGAIRISFDIAPTRRADRCVFGAITQADDLPVTAISYSRFDAFGVGAAQLPDPQGAGNFLVEDRVDQSTTENTVEFNPLTNEVTFRFGLTMEREFDIDLPPETVDLGILTGTVAVDPQTRRFEGLLSSDTLTNGEIQIAGYLFGPQATEAAFALGIKAETTDGVPVIADTRGFLAD